MRAYRIVLSQLAPIPKGIQMGHAMDQCWRNAYVSGEYEDIKQMVDFATNHKTYVDLDGGTVSQLSSIEDLIMRGDHPYPCGSFREYDLGGILTAVVVVVPEKLYSQDSKFVSLYTTEELESKFSYSPWEQEFMRIKESLPLAR